MERMLMVRWRKAVLVATTAMASFGACEPIPKSEVPSTPQSDAPPTPGDIIEDGAVGPLTSAGIDLSDVYAINIADWRVTILADSGRRALAVNTWWVLLKEGERCFSSIVTRAGAEEREGVSCTDAVFSGDPVGPIGFDLNDLSTCLADAGLELIIPTSPSFTLLHDRLGTTWRVSLGDRPGRWPIDANTCALLDPF